MTRCLLLVLAFLSGLPVDARGAERVPRFETETLDFPVRVPAAFRSTTGYLVVYEDRSRPGGPTLRLPVVVVHPASGADDASPVLYLSGGPGTSALNAAAYPGAYPWTADRPFVVFGQRGTAFAEPALECPEFSDGGPGDLAAVEACRERLTASGIDLGAYSTAASAADVDDLRRVLGVDRWTLYGVSYGTRLALAILRDFPGTVRVAVLDSVLPPQVRYDDESARNREAALGLVFRDCAASASCAEAYPDLRARFETALAAAGDDPLSVAVEGADAPRRLSAADLAGLADLGSPSGIAAAPRLLDAIARGDAAALAPFLAGSGGSGFAWGMRLSVWCGEALPYSDRATASGPGTVLGGIESAAVTPEACAAWDVPVRPPAEVRPVLSAVPTLLLAGEFDPHTPPRWADAAARWLVNRRVVVLRGGAHIPTQNWGGDGCAMAVAAAFVRAPASVVGPSAGALPCVAARGGPAFDVGEQGR